MNRLLDWLRNLFKSSSSRTIDTVPLHNDQALESHLSPPKIEPQQFTYACGQSSGKQREHNEDHLIAFSITLGGQGNNFPLGLFIVADGMGGQQFGEIASMTAVRTMGNYLFKKFHPYLTDPSQGIDEPLQDILHTAIQEAQLAVTKVAPGSGTTVTAALILGQQLTIGHVGDSRAYAVLSPGQITPLTRDHSLVRRLEELGHISSAEFNTHPQRNVLYRAVGQGDILEPDIFTTPFPQSGYLLLCSDGLWSVVPETTLLKIIYETPNLNTACQKMVAAANEAGGPDNISVILVQLLG